VRLRITRVALAVGVALMLGSYAELAVHAPATGQDLRIFYAAATTLREGGNPYDAGQLLRVEERLYHPRDAAARASLAGNPYVQGPPLAIALLPLTGRAPAAVYHGEALLLVLAAVAAVIVLARGSPALSTAHASRRALILLISPVTFLGVLLGQPDALLLLLLVAALSLYRRHALLAGFILALGLVKPQIMAGPLLLCGLLAWRRGRVAPYAMGALGGALLFLGGSAAIAGPAVVTGWLRELAGFSGATVYTQVDISSLSTLYVGWAPHALSLLLAVAGLAAWTTLCVKRPRATEPGNEDQTSARNATAGEPGEHWWFLLGLAGWLLVTPYAHPHDDILLLPAAWYLLERGPYRGRAALIAVLLVLSWWLLPMTSLLGLRPPLLRGLGVIPVALTFALLATRRPAAATGAATTGLPNRAIGSHRIAL